MQHLIVAPLDVNIDFYYKRIFFMKINNLKCTIYCLKFFLLPFFYLYMIDIIKTKECSALVACQYSRVQYSVFVTIPKLHNARCTNLSVVDLHHQICTLVFLVCKQSNCYTNIFSINSYFTNIYKLIYIRFFCSYYNCLKF